MKKLNTYITEAWSGVKKQTNYANIEAWCDEVGIQKYTINSKGEIDVDGYVKLSGKNFEELPYKFGKVNEYFSLWGCKSLTSLKNCPDETGGYFDVDKCNKLESLEGCPKEVRGGFYCKDCKRKFTRKEVNSLCKVKRNIEV